jgi:ABC-type dipeptide/oligopeptide/nickel transport system permease subunit
MKMSRRKLYAIVGVVVVVVLVVLFVVGPLVNTYNQQRTVSQDRSFVLSDPGQFTWYYINAQFQQAGTYQFTWTTANGNPVGFVIAEGSPSQGPSYLLYQGNGTFGSGSVAVVPSGYYWFGVYAWNAETVYLNGTVNIIEDCNVFGQCVA